MLFNAILDTLLIKQKTPKTQYSLGFMRFSFLLSINHHF